MAVFEYIGGGGGSSDVVGYPAGTKMYVALLTQTGTDAPVATVLVNTLGGTVVWSYGNVGDYTATLSGVFTESKTIMQFLNNLPLTQYISETANVQFSWVSVNAVNISGLSDNGILSNTPIQILVFP